MSELQKFDADHLKNLVTEKIRASFVELIPQEHWDSIVAKEVQNFIDRDLPQAVKKELMAMVTDYLKDELKSATWPSRFGVNGKSTASEILKKIVVDNADEIFAKIYADASSMMLHNIIGQLHSRNY